MTLPKTRLQHRSPAPPRLGSLRQLALIPLAGLMLFFPATASAEPGRWPSPAWESGTPEDAGMNGQRLAQAREYAPQGGGSGMIIRHGIQVMTWGDLRQRYDLKSTTKSFGATALGVAIADGKLALSEKLVKHHSQFADPQASEKERTWRESITLEHLATHTAGFEKPGGYGELLFAPGSRWLYSDGGPNWLAECVTLAYGRDVESWMFERVFTPIGITREDLRWRRNQYREPQIAGVMRREFGSGVHANVDAMARLGYLYLCQGHWKDRRILTDSFVAQAASPVKTLAGLEELDAEAHGDASEHYGYLWWNNADGTLAKIPRDAFWSWGLYDSLILVIPSLDLVAARAGRSWDRPRESDGHYDVLAPFFEPIVDAVRLHEGPAYPPSPVIESLEWAPPSTIVRQAKGGDNWPITWGDDDLLYTAYGDGRGFEPFAEKKLSMGLATVSGPPDAFEGTNLRSPTAEREGDGKHGAKVSSLLMIDGVLYLLARNTGNAQLAVSTDHGVSWEWMDWKFTESFGYPIFLNFGKDYAGARDESVFLYSQDADSAYERADHMVLARVHKAALKDREAYQFFQHLTPEGRPVWTEDIKRRGFVIPSPGRCYRSSVSYHAGSKRYLWCQTGLGEDTRFQGGFAIYDAPEPWGPWTTVYHTESWDTGPGETSCLPTKWMKDGGRSLHLVFSGEDSFSVRGATLTWRSPVESSEPSDSVRRRRKES